MLLISSAESFWFVVLALKWPSLWKLQTFAQEMAKQAEKLKNTLRIEAHSCGLISHVSWRNLPARLDDRHPDGGRVGRSKLVDPHGKVDCRYGLEQTDEEAEDEELPRQVRDALEPVARSERERSERRGNVLRP